MNPKTQKIIFVIPTGLLTVIVLMFTANSIFNQEVFAARFTSLGYPSYLIYPLAAANLLGLVAIWTNKSRTLKEWAYAGFFFNFILAFLAEFHAVDGEMISSPLAIVFLFASYFFGRPKE